MPTMKLSAQRRFHTKKILHTETLKRRRFHIQKLVIIQVPFMHKRFSTCFLHADAFAEIFAHRALLCVDTRTFSQREIFPAQKLFTCRIVPVWFGMFFAHLVWEEFVRQEFFRSYGESSEQENHDLLQCVRSSGASSARKKQITMLLGVGLTRRDASKKQCVEVWKLWVNVVSVR